MTARTVLKRLVPGVVAALVATGSIAGIGLALATQARAAEPLQPVPGLVIGHRCNGLGAVDALRIVVEQPGVVTLTWDNKKACGAPA